MIEALHLELRIAWKVPLPRNPMYGGNKDQKIAMIWQVLRYVYKTHPVGS